jgi:hypothetical protein
MRVLACVLTLVATTASAATVAEYEALRASRPDGRIIPVEGLILVRDAYRIELRSGVVHLLAPAAGHTFGAVFLGEGAYHLTPATSAERRHLRLVTGDAKLETLSDRFDRLVFFFTDRTAEEMTAHGPMASGAPNEQAVRVYGEYLKRQQIDVQINLLLRVLGDLLNRPGRTDGVFLAAAEGRAHGKVLMAIDPLGISNLSPRMADLGGEEVALISTDERKGGFWYLSALTKQAVAGRGKPSRPLADAASYEIDTTIDSRELRGRTTIALTPVVDGLRVLPLHIDDTISIRSATLDAAGTAATLAVVRDDVVRGGYQQMFSANVADGDVALVFPEPLALGKPVRVQIEYDGREVLEGSGGRFAVRARASWYPNLGTFVDLATYDMTFRYPRRNTLVAVGQRVSERIEGGQKIAHWQSGIPIRVAGFNYGEFEKLTTKDSDTGLAVGVYTNRDWTSQARIAQADAMNASRVATTFFGKQPFAEVSITQQVQSNFGQSWPTLVFLPTVALTTSTERATNTSVDPRAMRSLQEFVNVVGWHEIAHQWWGHQVGWQSYRDQWLSEGFAEFTAALTLEFAESRRSYDRFWALRRGEILERRGAVAAHDAGAITQGFRLATERSPGASSAMLYAKGAYVLHMLRMMMREEGKNVDPDRSFRAMMTEFATTWAGKNPSTEDFQRVAEKHMLPSMDLAGNRRLDYFFEQWVYGTDIPRLGSSLQVTDVGGGRYRVGGAVEQVEIPAGFQTLVPVYLEFADDRIQKLGTVHLNGPARQNLNVEIQLPQRPRRVILNGRNDVLSR